MPNGETELLRAIRMGDLQTVKAFIKRGDSVQDSDYYGNSALHYSVMTGVTNITSLVLKSKESKKLINKCTIFHHTPLFLAALHNHYDTFCLLLSSGADPNTELMFGQTAIHWLVKNGRLKLLQVLIRYGADVNWLDCFGMSPLRIHLQSSMDIRITRLLINSGADINETKLEQTSILKIALYRWRRNRFQNIHLLMRHGADINAKSFDGETALHFAARVSAPAIVKLLVLRYNADITARNIFGHTPLAIALQFSNAETVETIRCLEAREIENQMRQLGI